MRHFLLMIFLTLGLSSLYSQSNEQLVKEYLQGNIDQKIEILFELHGDIEGQHEDSVLYFIKDLQSEGIKESREDALAFSSYYFGHYLNDHGLYKEAGRKLKEAERFFEYQEIDTMLAAVYNALGNNEFLQGNLTEAEKLYLKSINHGEKSNKENFKNLALVNLARIWIYQENYDEAKEIIEDYIEYNKRISNFRNVGTAYGIYGQLYLDQEKFNEAIDFLERSMEYNLSTGNPKLIANGYTNIAIANYVKENYDRAEKNFQLALAYRKEAGDDFFIAESYYNLGDFYFGNNVLDSALHYYEKSYEIAAEGNNKLGMKDALWQMNLIFEKQGKFEKQANTLKEFIEISEQMSSEKLTQELDILRASFIEEQKQQSFQGHKREEVLRDQVNKVSQIWDYWIWIIIIGLLMLTLIVLFSFSRRKSK